eukprot:4618720-Prymnesium_polylepis.2
MLPARREHGRGAVRGEDEWAVEGAAGGQAVRCGFWPCTGGVDQLWRPCARGLGGPAALTALEVRDGRVAVVLPHPAVERRARQALLEQLLEEVVARLLRVDKHQQLAVIVVAAQQVAQSRQLLLDRQHLHVPAGSTAAVQSAGVQRIGRGAPVEQATLRPSGAGKASTAGRHPQRPTRPTGACLAGSRRAQGALLDGVRDDRDAADDNLHRLAEHGARELLDCLWERGREEHRLARGPHVADDAVNLRRKAHVEHTVRLVEHHVRRAAQVGHAAASVRGDRSASGRVSGRGERDRARGLRDGRNVARVAQSSRGAPRASDGQGPPRSPRVESEGRGSVAAKQANVARFHPEIRTARASGAG